MFLSHHTHLKERSIMVITSPCFKRSDCCKTSPLTRVGFAELKLVKMTWQKERAREKHHMNNENISKQKHNYIITQHLSKHSPQQSFFKYRQTKAIKAVALLVFSYLFILIQVNPAVLLGDLRKLNTNITVRLPVRSQAEGIQLHDKWNLFIFTCNWELIFKGS